MPGSIWVDFLVIAVVLYYIYNGYRRGFIILFFELLGVVLVLLFAFKTYPLIAHFLTIRFQLFRSLANMAGFLSMLLFGQLAYYIIFCFVCHRLEKVVVKSRWARADRILGVVPGLAMGLVLVTLLLSILVAVPLSPWIKWDVTHSRLGGPLFASTGFFAPYIEKTLGQPANDLLAFLTPKPQELITERLALPDVDNRLSIDTRAEEQMIVWINQERQSRGIDPVSMDPLLTNVARQHSQEMWQLRYFAHVSPISGTLVQRLLQAGATFRVAGENIALAPDVLIAFRGLMNSPGHRRNILDPDFRRVGVGGVSAGIYGEMFTQNFTD